MRGPAASLGRLIELVVHDDGRGLPARPPRRHGWDRGDARTRVACPRDAQAESSRDTGTTLALRVPVEGTLMPVPLKTRILLADDHAVVRGGLRLVLDAAAGPRGRRRGRRRRRGASRSLCGRDRPRDPRRLDAAVDRPAGRPRVTRRKPELRVLMLSMHDNEQYFFEALKAGASGYVLKSAANRDLIEACRAAMRGEPFLYPAAVTALIRDYLDAPAAARDPRGSAHPARARGVEADRRGAHQPRRSPRRWSSARRRSIATAPTSSRSSACETASS